MNVIARQTQTTNGQGQMPFTKVFCKRIESVAAVAVQCFAIRRKNQPTIPDAQGYSLRPSFLPALGTHVLQSNTFMPFVLFPAASSKAHLTRRPPRHRHCRPLLSNNAECHNPPRFPPEPTLFPPDIHYCGSYECHCCVVNCLRPRRPLPNDAEFHYPPHFPTELTIFPPDIHDLCKYLFIYNGQFCISALSTYLSL